MSFAASGWNRTLLLTAVAVIACSATAWGIDTDGSCILTVPGTVIACDDWDNYASGSLPTVSDGVWTSDGCTNLEVSSDRPWVAPHSLKENKIDAYPGLGGRRAAHSLFPRIQQLDPSKGSVNGTDANPLVLHFQLYGGTAVQGAGWINLPVELNDGFDKAPATTILHACGQPYIPKETSFDHNALAFGSLAALDPNPCDPLTIPQNTRFALYNGSVWLSGQESLEDQLVTLNTSTGLGTLVATTSGISVIQGMAFDHLHNHLYAVVKDNGGQLIRIDTATGAVTTVASAGSEFMKGLVFNPDANVLYMSNEADHYLYTFDLTTGTRTQADQAINAATTNLTSVQGLAYDAGSNILYGVAGGPDPDALITIDAATGVGSVLGEGSLRTHRYECRSAPIPAGETPCRGCCGQTCNDLAISNPSFESPALSNGQFDGGQVPGWVETPGGSSIGVIDLDPSFLAGVWDDAGLEALDGENAVWMGVAEGAASILQQPLGGVLTVGTQYSLSVGVSRRNALAPKPYTVELLAGTNVIASVCRDGSNLASPVGWTIETLPYLAGAGDPNLGGALSIRISVGAPGVQTLFDNVQLSTPSASTWCKELNDESFNDIKGLEFDPNTNTLYGTDSTKNALVTIGTTSTTRPLGGPDRVTRVTPKGQQIGFESVDALAFDPNASTLYGGNQHTSPAEDVRLTTAWNCVTATIKTNTIDIRLENSDAASPFELTFPRAYLGGFTKLAIGNSGCVGSRYPGFVDLIYAYGGELGPVIAATGACCLPAGTCGALTQVDCLFVGGAYRGDNSACPEFCCPVPWADADRDGDVDMNDFGAFQACFTGDQSTVLAGQCACFDKVTPGDLLNASDFNEFIKCVTGPAIPFVPPQPPNCLP